MAATMIQLWCIAHGAPLKKIEKTHALLSTATPASVPSPHHSKSNLEAVLTVTLLGAELFKE
jgi:hypothetical protein